MHTNFQDLIPQKVLFSIKEIADLGIIKSDLCKKLIYNRQIEIVKLGNKIFISRAELISHITIYFILLLMDDFDTLSRLRITPIIVSNIWNVCSES